MTGLRSSPRSVHPRVRGEHALLPVFAETVNGPSPRARGTPWRALQQQTRRPVHPRVRGEHPNICERYAKIFGPSPRARGTLVLLCNTGRNYTVHPRVRGEHDLSLTPDESAFGPSPRARGTRAWPLAQLRVLRSIPACAGNTPLAAPTCGPASVHPRVRGEHALIRCAIRRVDGPSPRARGTPEIKFHTSAGARSIPACAGNTRTLSCCARPRAVHPRVRGEHVRPVSQSQQYQRSIPACAGNTISSPLLAALQGGPSPRARGTPVWPRSTTVGSTVHPRVRGEHVSLDLSSSKAVGPSPRARGTQGLQPLRLQGRRSIPACAGNTLSWFSVSDVPAGPSPRARGTLAHVGRLRRCSRGPSPRARGTRAGHRCSGQRRPVHPRVRGGHGPDAGFAVPPDGPSPRARGTRRRAP